MEARRGLFYCDLKIITCMCVVAVCISVYFVCPTDAYGGQKRSFDPLEEEFWRPAGCHVEG